MTLTDDFYEMLYVSTMTPTAPVSMVSKIAMQARVSNAVQRITGMLIFDGLRFCQYVEGSKNDVIALFERICADSRHAAITLIHQGPLQERRFNKFSLAFANGDDYEALSRLELLKGETGLSAFAEMIPTLDLEVQRC